MKTSIKLCKIEVISLGLSTFDILVSMCIIHEYEYFRTSSAMSGKMDFREALAARLQIIKPSLKQIRDFIQDHPFHLTPGIK